MLFQVGEQVVHTAYGVGRIVGLVQKCFSGTEAQPYYEIVLPHGTTWVPQATTAPLRHLTAKSDLVQCREVLRGRPTPLTKDHRQRRQLLLDRLRRGAFLAACEVVRDLSAAAWRRSPGDAETTLYRRVRQEICAEWAAVSEMTLQQAEAEVDALLQEARVAYRD